MTDKVQKIREEVERVKAVHSSITLKDSKPDILAVQVCINLLSFIDSLQEESEPQFKVGDTIRSKVWESAVHKIVYVDDNAYFFENGGMVRFADQEQWELVEEPVSDDLEKAAKEWDRKASFTPFYMTLDNNGNPNGVRQQYTTHAESFKAGANWQKEQMMENSVECTVHVDAGGYPYIGNIELYDYENDKPLAKAGDKVKVIINN